MISFRTQARVAFAACSTGDVGNCILKRGGPAIAHQHQQQATSGVQEWREYKNGAWQPVSIRFQSVASASQAATQDSK